MAEAFWEWQPSQATVFMACRAVGGGGGWRFALMAVRESWKLPRLSGTKNVHCSEPDFSPWLVLQQLVAFSRSLSMITSRLRTVRDHIRWAVSRFHEEDVFFGHGTDNAWDEARQLVLGALHLPWEIADSYLDCRLEVDEISELQRLIKRRIDDRVPTPYLLGEAWFCGMSFIVDDRVLIPRSPIAELIEERFAPWLANEPALILDLCTGSGCIGIACAEVFPEAEVALADLSYDALEVANQNIERHGMEDRVYTVQGDGFDGLPGQRFDLIVSNPPYVDAEDFADMPDEYQHEPELALACGSDGLNLVRRMLAQAADHLNEKGLLIVEVGNSQVHVQALYPEVDFAWLDFQRGGHGVFMLTAEQCRNHQALFQSKV
ncbi:50S ribosomal protein L3 glutamine methyltransferase [Pseudomonas savastanoi pv. glycinea]|uniref:Ribosomal protein uL3 glutamine methyltransferase n=5 Tax=Pseudomonas TaxID=286 RepID=A0A3M3FJ21_PSESG|nr:50S ribosomal protein L3 glutamine methyltransferase [Pseudomonas savastanoi pv. glycinea]RMN33432.1 50S ribosomal protein L3 glutamine methyltransferase [Pseudomonas savastanoi pv. glycinea]RMO50775.1 50S ribosomal protein L3 glutamine methyltransferase [Pseudomonas savastanoi pv. glycinea]RMQ60077.1 50S ribosomal protein L3 glutamine methyltransferase [Pseudomonas savastanoi pv. glycinea]